MAKGRLILICHFGGEVITNDNGTISYNGGEANAVNVTNETSFIDLKIQVTEAYNLDQKTVTIKYLHPGNKKFLIVVKTDKDVKRMIDYHGDAITAEVFVMGTPGFKNTEIETQSNKKDNILNNDDLGNKKKEPAKHGRQRIEKDDIVPTSPPGKRTRRAKADVASDDSADMADGATSDSSINETSSSNSSDFEIRKKRDNQSEIKINVDSRPVDTVKKRRWTPSWKFGANGRLTIISRVESEKSETSGGKTSQRKSNRLAAKEDSFIKTRSVEKSTVPVIDINSDQELDTFSGKEIDLTVNDDYTLPETTVDSWKSAITGAGQQFDSVNEFRAALKKYAIANRFGYKFKKNNTIRANGGCTAEGCTWKFCAVWVATTQSFTIKTLNNVHTCDKDSRMSSHPAKNWLVGTIKDRLRESPYLKPKEIANGLSQDFGVELSYSQVWRGIVEAREQLHGSAKESYNKLPWFCEKFVEINPGSIAKLVVNEKKRFKSLFVAFNPLIDGFNSNCRPIIFLESVSLKSRYGEILFTANAVNGNDGFFPVAFGVVDVEDDDNWVWFLGQLKSLIMNTRVVTFVVDRDKNFKDLVIQVFENAVVGYSIYHLLAGFKRIMKGPFHGEGILHFLGAAHAVRVAGFKKSVEQIKVVSSRAYDWVMEIEPENWASCYFKGERYNYITKDIGESYAKLMEDYKLLPILQKIDALIRMVIDGMEDARLEADRWSTQLTGSKERELEQEKVNARGLKVFVSSDTLFEVREVLTHVVNVGNSSCTCMGFKETGLPCRHAIAVFMLTGKSPYDFCSGYFTADAYRLTYAVPVYPVPIDGAPLQNPIPISMEMGDRTQKEEGLEKEVEVEGGNMEDGEKMEVQKDEGNDVIAEKEESSKLDDEKVDDGIVDASKEDGCKLDAEKDDGCIVDVDKDEGVNVDVEKDGSDNVDVEKDEGGNVGVKKDDGVNVDVDKDEGVNVDVEKDKGVIVDVEKNKGGNVGVEKDDDGNLHVEKDEGGSVHVEKDDVANVDVEKDKGVNVDVEKDGGGNVDGEKEEGSKLDMEKAEGGKLDIEKEEGKNVKFREEYENPNVLVLPPVPTKSTCSVVKKEKDKVEREGEIKRKATSSKSKQPKHYNKSCQTKL